MPASPRAVWLTRLALWAPVALAAAALFSLSSQSSLPLPENSPDKVAHTIAFAIFGVLCLRALHRGLTPLRWAPTVGAVTLTILYGALDELHQAFVPGRSSSVWDLAADAVGALLAIVLVAAWVRLRPGTPPTRE